MADYTVTIDFPDHKLGDKWLGISAIGPVLINSATPSDALVRVRLHFRRHSLIFRCDSTAASDVDAPIVISNPATWLANVPEIPDFLSAAGLWHWDMEFWGNGWTGPLTLYKGVITVHQDVTK